MELTPAQCRAARALVDLSREALAGSAKVAVRTISDFEAGRREPINATKAAIRRALEEAGVQFLEEGGTAGGPGVALRAG